MDLDSLINSVECIEDTIDRKIAYSELILHLYTIKKSIGFEDCARYNINSINNILIKDFNTHIDNIVKRLRYKLDNVNNKK